MNCVWIPTSKSLSSTIVNSSGTFIVEIVELSNDKILNQNWAILHDSYLATGSFVRVYEFDSKCLI